MNRLPCSSAPRRRLIVALLISISSGTIAGLDAQRPDPPMTVNGSPVDSLITLILEFRLK